MLSWSLVNISKNHFTALHKKTEDVNKGNVLPTNRSIKIFITQEWQERTTTYYSI